MTGTADEDRRRNPVPVTLVIRAWQETGHNGFRARIIRGPRRTRRPAIETTTDPEQVMKMAREWLAALQNPR
jgi:hypothetical protein